MQPKYTIRDIAKLSGFSFKTVSRVLNEDKNVKPSTRDKILQVIADTNYKPNIYARNLSSKTNKNVLVSIRKTHGQNTTQWFDYLMSFMTKQANARGFTVIQEVIYDDSDLRHSMLEKSGGYIDVLVLFYLSENDKRIELADRSNIPFISFEKNPLAPLSISNDNKAGMYEAAEFLFGRGLTSICLLLGAEIDVNRERADAIREVYSRRNVPSERLEIVYGMNNLEAIRSFVDGRIEQGKLPEVFFVSGDEKAIAVYSSLHAHGLSIPKDVSVIGFDNIPISQYYCPPLTTMGQDFERLAFEMFGVIEKLVEGETDIASVQVEPRLIVRDSVR
ncbi:LacI family DNA-binding transcriptional regulator [Cohnella thailandensis]|uniref:LacI family DNA-binding transcriptional regulator n=1 Tax=Cohnella thailandensis TaxID=557557 RepID=A0A841SQM9_9BACL|nr:LacI family DNA-binding transcriptional regulator [Cohnella thailandensis]MBB6633179.1 LacI family DNA-binding transcriptional regulator [Cohnella thailandensis]MBP1975124.1 DNA-binding LacI/PurR family transcriptional regulator [Cohnella thailandensis]